MFLLNIALNNTQHLRQEDVFWVGTFKTVPFSSLFKMVPCYWLKDIRIGRALLLVLASATLPGIAEVTTTAFTAQCKKLNYNPSPKSPKQG